MRDDSFQFLKQLVEAPSPSGFEEPVQKIIKQVMGRFADEVKTDVHGNVIGVKNPEGRPRVMLAGHCDEIGFMVKYIDKNGYLFFSTIGGIDRAIIPGQRVWVHTRQGPILGVMGKKPIHIMEETEKKRVTKLSRQWIDIGVKDGEEAKKLVFPGDPITFSANLQRLRGDLVVARGFDDKMGSWVVCEVLRYLAENPIEAAIFATSTVQEEIGLRGAQTAAYSINPQIGVVVEVGIATDFPEVNKRKYGEVEVGKGVILYRGPNINPGLGELLMETAHQEEVPYQIVGVDRATSTDANVIQLNRSGVATVLVGVPLRYLHTPVEILSLEDLENAVKLISSFILRLKEGMSFIPA